MHDGSSGIEVSFSRHILLIEDHDDGREALRLVLEEWGHRVDVAADGLAGVNQALALRPEVALIDLGLPSLDGFQVAQRLRAAFGQRIFLIACTAYGSAEDRRRAQEAGFNVHLVKPINLHQLSRWLERVPGGCNGGLSEEAQAVGSGEVPEGHDPASLAAPS